MASAPLQWGRFISFVMRLTQAMFPRWMLRLHCFVDDPAMAVQGSASVAAFRVGLVLLLWEMLGLRLAYSKGLFGRSITWIGCYMSSKLIDGIPGVYISIAEKKFMEIVELTNRLKGSTGMVPLRDVRRLAGQLAWASSICEW
eukprot:3984921-Amphidinium_carterae.1